MLVTPAQTAAHLARRQAAKVAKVAERAAFVQSRLPAAAEILRVQFGATRVWLFGSHVVGVLHQDSDVDFAVEGVSPTCLDRAAAELESIVEGVVDLVHFESAADSLRLRIETEGRSL